MYCYRYCCIIFPITHRLIHRSSLPPPSRPHLPTNPPICPQLRSSPSVLPRSSPALMASTASSDASAVTASATVLTGATRTTAVSLTTRQPNPIKAIGLTPWSPVMYCRPVITVYYYCSHSSNSQQMVDDECGLNSCQSTIIPVKADQGIKEAFRLFNKLRPVNMRNSPDDVIRVTSAWTYKVK